MVVYGADPDKPIKEWDDGVRMSSAYVSPPVRELLNYFGYHKQMKMSHVWDDKAKAVVARLVSKRLKQGYTVQTVKHMIDRFYQSWAADSEAPAYTFTSNEVQRQLTLEADVVKDDPVLEWLLLGMPLNTELFTEPAEMRKVVSLYGMQCMLRAPEQVADIIRTDDPEDGIRDELERLWEKVRDQPPHDTLHQAIAAIPIRKKESKW